MAAYSLTIGSDIKKTGREQLPKKDRDALILAAGSKCQICGATHDLQIDHRVPYEVAAESLDERKTSTWSYAAPATVASHGVANTV